MAQHDGAIADAEEGANSEIGPVGQEAESREEAQNECAWHAQSGRAKPEKERQQHADHRAAPNDGERMRIVGKVGARDRQRMQNHPYDPAACHPGSDDMT